MIVMIDETARNGSKINKDNDKSYLFSFVWAEERKISLENKNLNINYFLFYFIIK